MRPILQKGDRFKVPEKTQPQRYVAEYLKVKSVIGGDGPRSRMDSKKREVAPAVPSPRLPFPALSFADGGLITCRVLFLFAKCHD
jgi:hypothetical protein